LKLHRWFNLIVVILIVIQPLSGLVLAAPQAQIPDPLIKAQALLDLLSPEEKIGQLFIVQLDGTDISPTSEIYNLIVDSHIGGIVLKRENDNFIGPEEIIQTTFKLNKSLQTIEYESSLIVVTDFETQEEISDEYVPLFIGLSQDGDNIPNDQILSSLSPQPSLMALGATWDPEIAYRAGEILGFELRSLGFNMLLGPSLNILSSPRPESSGDINVNSFGGNPFWVAKMGSAYVAGVHSGSYGTMLVVAENFPGISSPDRPWEEEIPIIRKTYEELTQTNFVSFSELTDLSKDKYNTVDGLLVSHAKYEALQGTIRPSTRPLSFDETNLQSLIQLPEFNDWWLEGGLLVSDNLSTNAIQRFYLAQEEEFDVRLVALNAFLAGNDILNLGDYKFEDLTISNGYQNITETINLFIQKYQEDELFSQKVDAAVLRILKAKYNLFPGFDFSSVIDETIDTELIGLFNNNSLSTALESATLISPSIDDLIISMPEAPLQSDRILILTDTETAQQCSDCPETDFLSVTSFQQAALKLYGPDAGSRVLEQNMVSYSLQDLTEFLSEQENPEINFQFESDISSSEWIILLLQEINGEDPDSLSILQLINERFDLIQQKKIVVFSINAPYYLDTTITSNVSVIYGLYSKQPQFIDVAVRLLFKELSAPGASPVSIQSTGYDLATALTPAADQIVNLSVEIADQQTNTNEDNQAEVTEFEYEIGDTIHIQSSMVLDQNGNSVPDNTLAIYTMTVINNNEIVSQREISSKTNDGVASATVTLDNAGALTINATIGDSLESTELKLEIIDVNNIPVETEVVPDSTEESDQPQSIPNYDIVTALKFGDVTMSLWLLLVLMNAFVSVFAYQAAINSGQVRWGIRHAFTTFIGGILIIIFLSSGMDFVRSMLKDLSLWEVAVLTIIGSLIGWLFGVIWRYLSLKKLEN